MRTFSTYLEILKKKGVCYSIHEVWKKIQRVHFIRDDNILKLQWNYLAYKRLKKYAYVLNRPFQNEMSIPNPYPDKIWVAWLQGEKNAPALVKKCLASIRKYANGKEVVLITEDNITQYVQFPDYITKKKNMGRIPNTQFSDLLRISLLAQYGGIWIDSTVLLTAPLPDYITQEPLFCYKSFFIPGKEKASSWLIAAKRNHEIIVRTKDMLMEYWKHEKYLKNYSIFHLFFAIVIDSFPHLTQQWKAVPCFNNASPHILLFELHDPYNEKRWEQIKNISPVHKLTYKFSPELLRLKGTFLQKILME